MVQWADEAVEEAINAYSDSWRCYYEEDNELCRNRMRAALDAAVKVQFWPNTVAIPYQMAHQAGANWAIKNVVKIAEFYGASEVAESIRNLSEEGK